MTYQEKELCTGRRWELWICGSHAGDRWETPGVGGKCAGLLRSGLTQGACGDTGARWDARSGRVGDTGGMWYGVRASCVTITSTSILYFQNIFHSTTVKSPLSKQIEQFSTNVLVLQGIF